MNKEKKNNRTKASVMQALRPLPAKAESWKEPRP